MDKKAVIFDMNGVIVNDERIHQQAWREWSKKHGFELSEEEFKTKIFGRTEKETFNNLFEKELSESEVEEYSAERIKIAIDLYKGKIALTEGLQSFLEELESAHIPTGIATSARTPYTNFVLDTLKIRHFFKEIVTAIDIENGKPHPEIYLKVASKLRVDPTICVVIEDSLSGIKSAKAAGMYVIGITTTHSAEELKSADRIINSFNELTVAIISTV